MVERYFAVGIVSLQTAHDKWKEDIAAMPITKETMVGEIVAWSKMKGLIGNISIIPAPEFTPTTKEGK